MLEPRLSTGDVTQMVTIDTGFTCPFDRGLIAEAYSRAIPVSLMLLVPGKQVVSFWKCPNYLLLKISFCFLLEVWGFRIDFC